jgi:SAM-dependent methyltransferase
MTALQGGAFYDDQQVFDTYMAHRARPTNPNDTIEEPAFAAVLGPVRGQRVLDLGCGDGRYGVRMLADGCARYVGVEASTNMATLARAALGSVEHTRIEDFTPPPASFDVVISRLALHYVEQLEPVFARVRCALAPAGRFIFTVEHPVITSSDHAWQGRGHRQDWQVDDYFRRGRRETQWLGGRVVKFHRTVEDYVRLLQSAGFQLQTLREPEPDLEYFQSEAEFNRRQRIPLFLLVAGSVP